MVSGARFVERGTRNMKRAGRRTYQHGREVLEGRESKLECVAEMDEVLQKAERDAGAQKGERKSVRP